MTNWVKEKAKSLLNAAKAALGIHSPSRLFQNEVGLNIGLGIGEGLDDSTPTVLDSVIGIADAIAEEFNAGEYRAANIVPTTEVNGALISFSDTIANSFSDLMDRMQAIANSTTFSVPAIAMGAVVPYSVSTTAQNAGYADSQKENLRQIMSEVVDDHISAMMAGFEASLAAQKEILEAIYGIEIGDETIGRANSRYQKKQAVMKGGW